MFIGLAFGTFLIFSLVGSLFLANLTGIPIMEMSDPDKWDYSNPALLTFLRGMLVVQFLGLFVIPSFLFAYFSDPHPLTYLGLKPAHSRYFILGALLLIVALPLVDWLGVFNHRLIPETTSLGKWMKASEEQASRQISFMLKKRSLQDLLLNLLFVAVFAGIGEELLFRGMLQRILIRLFKNPAAGIIITAVIFSAIHLQFYGFLPRFILGILLGCIYWYSGSLWPAILAHFIYDAFAVVMIYFNPALADQEGATLQVGNQIVLALLSAMLVAAILVHMKKKSVSSYAEIYTEETSQEANPFS
jgi:hypothetical protein